VVIPAFNEKGVLPAGRFGATVAELEQRFVQTFPASATRAALFNGLRLRHEELSSIVPIEWEWIDGSFVTSKSNAGDIDVATFISADSLTPLTLDQRRRVFEITTNPHAQLAYGCDSYLVVVFEEGHSMHGQYLSQRGYWDRWWSKDDNDEVKGYIEVREI
jgi:hypothetical protein